jgi:rare lipoprotein A
MMFSAMNQAHLLRIFVNKYALFLVYMFVLGLLPFYPKAQDTLRGKASYYNDIFHGKPTSTGELYDRDSLTCACKNYPVGSILRVTREDNGLTTEVKVNDCGPHVKDRVIDLSRAAAREIDLIRDGVTVVIVELLVPGTGKMPCRGSSPFPMPSPGESGADSTSLQPQADSMPEIPEIVLPAVGYMIQTGSYGNLNNALALQTRLQNIGLSSAFIIKKNNLYKVMTGIYNDQNQAEADKQRLNTEFSIQGIIINIQKW